MPDALARWWKRLAVHDPGKILLDLAMSLLGGEASSDITVLRSEPGVYGRVASDPAVSRLIKKALAEGYGQAGAAIGAARQQARARVWA